MKKKGSGVKRKGREREREKEKVGALRSLRVFKGSRILRELEDAEERPKMVALREKSFDIWLAE